MTKTTYFILRGRQIRSIWKARLSIDIKQNLHTHWVSRSSSIAVLTTIVNGNEYLYNPTDFAHLVETKERVAP